MSEAHGGGSKNAHRTLDDLVSDADIGKAIEAYEKQKEEINPDVMFEEVFQPAFNSFYDALKTKMDDLFKDKKAKIQENLPKVRQALVAALEAYFKRAMPSVLKGAEGIKDLEDRFRHLAHHYDRFVLGIPEGREANYAQQGIMPISLYMESLKDKSYKNANIGRVKRELHAHGAAHIQRAQASLEEKAQLPLLKIPSHRLGQYLVGHLKKYGHEVDDKLEYGTLSQGELLTLREGVKTGEWPRDKPGPKHYGLKAKETEGKAAGGGSQTSQ